MSLRRFIQQLHVHVHIKFYNSVLHALYKQVIAAVPQLADHKAEIRQRLGQALSNRRKYEKDVKAGKRPTKGKSRLKQVLHSDI